MNMKHYVKDYYLQVPNKCTSNKSTKITFDRAPAMVPRNAEPENVFMSRNIELTKYQDSKENHQIQHFHGSIESHMEKPSIIIPG